MGGKGWGEGRVEEGGEATLSREAVGGREGHSLMYTSCLSHSGDNKVNVKTVEKLV